MSRLLAKRMAEQSPIHHATNRFMWKWAWVPVVSALFYFSRQKAEAIQAQRLHDERIIVTYRDYKKYFPYSYRRKWAEWVKEDYHTHFWWRKYEGKSLIEAQYCDDYIAVMKDKGELD